MARGFLLRDMTGRGRERVEAVAGDAFAHRNIRGAREKPCVTAAGRLPTSAYYRALIAGRNVGTMGRDRGLHWLIAGRVLGRADITSWRLDFFECH